MSPRLKKKIVDLDVPEPAKRPSQWDFVTRFNPSFTEEMLLIEVDRLLNN